MNWLTHFEYIHIEFTAKAKYARDYHRIEMYRWFCMEAQSKPLHILTILLSIVSRVVRNIQIFDFWNAYAPFGLNRTGKCKQSTSFTCTNSIFPSDIFHFSSIFVILLFLYLFLGVCSWTLKIRALVLISTIHFTSPLLFLYHTNTCFGHSEWSIWYLSCDASWFTFFPVVTHVKWNININEPTERRHL